MKQRRILVQLPSFDSGGAENYALRLIRNSCDDPYDWHVTSGNLRNATMEDAFRQAGAKVHHASPGYGKVGQAMAFQRFLRQQDFDTVMTLTGPFGGVALSLARLAGIPCRVAWYRRSTPAYAPTRGRRIYERAARAALVWGSTRILSNSRAALDNFHGSGWTQSQKFKVIANGVDSSRFRPQPEIRNSVRMELGIPAQAVVIGHVGRVDPAKDHDTLMAVTARLRERHSTLRLLLAGTGTDSKSFENRLVNAGIRDIALPLGVRLDVERVYQAMDVFLFPSVTEGQPNALIEAMLSGVPVAASDIPSIRETMPPMHETSRFPPGDVAAASLRVEAALADRGTAPSQIDWLKEQYDLSRNLDAVLRELDPSRTAPANA